MTFCLQEAFVTVHVDDSTYFRREGHDVHTEADISLSQAVLGGVIRIQGLYEDLNVRVPPETRYITAVSGEWT